MSFVQMEAGLMKIVLSLNRSWFMTLISAYIELFIRGKVRGEVGGKMFGYPFNRSKRQDRENI